MFFLAGLGIDLKEVRGVGDDSDGIGRAGVHALYDEGFTEAWQT